MPTITCVIRDNHNNAGVSYADPLIYTVYVKDPQDREEVHARCLRERITDLGFDDGVDIDVLFAFAGNLKTIADWRE